MSAESLKKGVDMKHMFLRGVRAAERRTVPEINRARRTDDQPHCSVLGA